MGDANTAFVLRTDQFAEVIRAMLAHPKYRWVFHNSAFDLLCLERVGLADALELHTRVEDTKILWHLIDPRGRKDGGHGFRLKDLARDLIDRSAPDTQDGLTGVFRKIRVPTDRLDKNGNPRTRLATKAEGWSLIDIDHPTYVLYAGLDVILTARLYDLGTDLVEKQGNTALAEWEHTKVQHVGLDMERRGALIDVPWTEQLSAEWQRQYDMHYERCVSLGLPNLNSTTLVVRALQDAGVKLTKKTKRGKFAADKEVLLPLAESGMVLAQEIIAAKRVKKRRSTYAVAMLEGRDEHDRVHPSLNTLQARTARMSMSNPNFQNLPSKEGDWHTRRCIIAAPGKSEVSTDLDQVEYRIAGAFSGETGIITAAKAGQSIHKATAELLFGSGYSPDQYSLAKNTGFCKLYGGGVDKIAKTSGSTREAAQDVVQRFNQGYPKLRKFARTLQDQILEDAGVDLAAYYAAWDLPPEDRKRVQKELTAGKTGYVQTPVGRWIPVDAERAYAGFNYLIQSTARDVLCRGLIRCHDAGLGQYMTLVVHDEVIAEVPTGDADDVARAFSAAMTEEFMGVPLTAAYDPKNVAGASWGHKYSTDEERADWLAELEEDEEYD